MSVKRLCFLFSLLFAFCSLAQQEFFLENKGQITDQFGDPRTDISFKYSFGEQTLFILNDGFDIISSNYVNEDEVKLSRIEFRFQDFQATSIDAKNPTPYKERVIANNSVFESGSFKELVYTDDRSNISIRYYIDDNGFKYDIVLPSGSSDNQFFVDVNGGEVFIENNDLTIGGSGYQFVETMPSVYAVQNDRRIEKKGEYHLTPAGYKITVDKAFNEEVVIDPYLTYATYYGGSSTDKIQAVAIGNDGSDFYAGYTGSANNIATVGAYQTTNSIYGSFFLAKFNELNQRLWGTYYQSSGSNVKDMHTDSSGQIYLAGSTGSGENLGTLGTHQVNLEGYVDCFIIKFNQNGFPIWSTLYGGNGYDVPYQMILEDESIYIAGSTTSDSLIATPGAFQEVKNGSGFFTDGFIAKFDTTGQLSVGTYFGGSNMDVVEGIDFSDNSLFISADLGSFGFGTPGTYQPTKSFQSDLFFARLDANLNLQWGSYFTGDSHVQSQHRIAVREDKIVLGFSVYTTAGNTAYATPGTYMDTAVEGRAICVLQFDTSGVNLDWGTYYDGDDYEFITDIFYPNDSSVLICGATRSLTGIATSEVHKPYITNGGVKYDVFVSCFDQLGQQKWGTYYGGEEDDLPLDAKLDQKNQLVVGGETKSLTAIPYGMPYQGFPSGNFTFDGFVFKLDIDRDSLFTDLYQALPSQACPKDILTVDYQLQGTFHTGNTFQLWLSDENGDFMNATLMSNQIGTSNGTFTIQFPNVIAGGNYRFKVISTDPVIEGSVSNPVTALASPETNFNYQVGLNDVYFVDQSLSASTWLWDFGDGNTSTVQNPSNNYSSIGMYSVLLISDNGICSDSAVHWIQISEVAGLTEQDQVMLIYPNPTTNVWKVYSEEPASKFLIHNLNGQLIQEGILKPEETEILVRQAGVYKMSVYNQSNELLNTFKLIRL
ncbi:MAG: PKD domain-containing protein [Crocinitomicaceae bacterium]